MSDQSPEKTLTLSSVMCENPLPSRSQQTNKIDRRTLSGGGRSRQRERERTLTQMISTKHPMKIPPILYISNDQNIVILM